MSGCGFKLDQQSGFLDEMNREIGSAGGTAVSYWQLRQDQNYDPVYGEADTRSGFLGPFTFSATLEYDEEGNYTQDASEEYVEREYDGVMTVARVEWDLKVHGGVPQSGFVAPREGDIVSFFDGFLFFEVLKVSRTGFFNTTATFSGYKIELKKRASFEPERRLP